MPAAAHNVQSQGSELLDATTGAWLLPNAITTRTVIFIHGWASDDAVLRRFAGYISAAKYFCALFHYDPFYGIDNAAADLATFITNTPALATTDFALVGHSMGGLVARRTRQRLSGDFRSRLRGIGMVATPNAGIPTHGFSRIVASRLARIIDRFGGGHPRGGKRSCKATQQLVLEDQPPRFITSLNAIDRRHPIDIPFLTISAGLPTLHLPGFAQILLNLIIGAEGHDGIVPETSADLRKVLRANPNGLITHHNNYPARATLNHFTILENQQVVQLLLAWLGLVLP